MWKQFIAGLLAGVATLAFAAVDVNKADQAQLEAVKGVGTRMSGKIIEARQSGPFKDWNDLIDRVPGIGPGSAARLSEAGLTVNGAAYDAAAPKADAGKPKAKPAGKAADAKSSKS